ncbi:MAG: type VI secretion system tip protein VgrG [Chitinophagales bacterium]|nr:type VI secretion system tip protein VgrG [Chitinophagales bacterium]
MTMSPRTAKTDLVTVDVLVDGKSIPLEYQILSIDIDKELNRISKAKIVFKDGSAAKSTFELSESKNFVPGNTLEVKAGYHSKNQLIFKGIIVSQNIRLNTQGRSSLEVSCCDESIKMTILEKDAFFQKMSDNQVMGKIIDEYKIKKKITNTKVKYEKLVQYSSTDWDFILSRAEVNGMVVSTIDGTITIEAPQVKKSPELEVIYGQTMYHFNLDMDARTQISKVKSASWNLATQKVLQATSSEPTVNTQGNISGKDLAKALTSKDLDIHSTVPLEQDSLKNWANARLLKSRMAKIQGSVTFQGSSKVQPGSTIKLGGLGKRFNGTAYVSSVRHKISKGNWETSVGVGLKEEWFTRQYDVSETPAAGLLPAISGLQNAIVKQVYKDPEKEFRVLIKIPVLKEVKEDIWARLSTFYTTTNKGGSFFYPEIGDEVLVGFLNNDPRYPVILGSMYSKKNAPPFTDAQNKNNSQKAIITKSKLKIGFDDQKKDIIITTPKGNTLELSESGKKVTLKDQNKNSIEMSSGGIKVKSNTNITISAKSKITLDAANIDIKAKANLKLNGGLVDIKAKMKAALQGLTTQVKASTVAILKGALVKIN